MARTHSSRYTMLGYLVWQGGKWYLRRRLPSPRKLAIRTLGAAAAAGAGLALAKRLAGQ